MTETPAPSVIRVNTRRVRGPAIVALAVLGALTWPAPAPVVPDAPEGAQRFTWNRDSVWRALEASFSQQRANGCSDRQAGPRIIAALDSSLVRLHARRIAATDARLDALDHSFFRLGTSVAACSVLANEYVALQGRLRDAIKWQSGTWDLSSRLVRDRLYQSLYGSRAAVEEAMLQQTDSVRPLYIGPDVPSATPSAVSNSVRLHSGDILVSRGGYPTSALIARGSDFPGNFSHIALVHVDSAGTISVVEAHIETGVAVGTAERYLADKKRRVMVLRLRPDLSAILQDPMLPHRAATGMLERARSEHVPYDFAMDYADPSRLFCSEVAAAAYRNYGITLWTGISTISSPGLRRWLASFGVRQFETQEPSDLEYDPQLQVVAEWRDAESLFEDHMDNAVTDAMLEGAERGVRLKYAWYALPAARMLKGYSWLRGRLGFAGPIPEGMAPSSALRNRTYNSTHAALKATLRIAAGEWTAATGYRPAYWTLVELARGEMARTNR